MKLLGINLPKGRPGGGGRVENGMPLPLLYIDENLRGLARWLRFLGFDTRLSTPGQPDRELLTAVAAEGRRLYTRDRDLAALGARFVKSAKTRDQLAEVLRELGRPPQTCWFSRCVLCNVPLREIARDERGEGVPGEFDRYWRCDACGRTYWRGSHYERSKRFLEAIPVE